MVYSREEKNRLWRKKTKWQEYMNNTEQYVVKFWALQNDGLVHQVEVSYFTSSKDAHWIVEQRWRKDYPLGKSGENELISVIYQ